LSVIKSIPFTKPRACTAAVADKRYFVELTF
jgi:hypothetical protein